MARPAVQSDARHTLIAVMFVSALSAAGIALPYPILTPIFLADTQTELTSYLDIHPKMLLGIALAFYPLGVLISNSFIGGLSDRYGRRRMMIVTLAGGAGGYILSGFALFIEDYPLFVLSRLFVGICHGNGAIAQAIAADLHPAVDRTRALSLLDAARSVGWAFGPLVGAYLMLFGASTAFYVAGVMLLIAMVLARLVISESAAFRSDAGDSTWRTIWRENSFNLLGSPGITRLFCVHCSVNLGLGAYFEYYPAWLVEAFGFGPLGIAYWTSAITAATILTSGFAVPAVA